MSAIVAIIAVVLIVAGVGIVAMFMGTGNDMWCQPQKRDDDND